MDMEEIFDFFVNFAFAPIILCLGLFGNFISLKVLKSKKLRNIGPDDVYRFLFIIDTFYLLQIVIVYFENAFMLDVTILSDLSCKIYIYFSYAFDAISPWLLVYISIEKYISISYTKKRFIMRQKLNQFIYMAFVITFILSIYVVQPFCYELMNLNAFSNKTNMTPLMYCNFINYELQMVSSYLDLIFRVMLPFVLMLTFSCFIIHRVFKSRNRISNSIKETKRLKRDIKFAIMSLFINLVFIILNLPLAVILFLPNYYSHTAFLFIFYLFFFSYGVNFYIMILVNSIFRNEFFKIFLKKKVNNLNENIAMGIFIKEKEIDKSNNRSIELRYDRSYR